MNHLGLGWYLVPVVSARLLSRARPLPIGPAGLLAPRLLLGPALPALVPGLDATLPVLRVPSARVVLPQSVPESRKHAVSNTN